MSLVQFSIFNFLQQCVCLGRKGECHGGTGGGTELNEVGNVNLVRGRFSGAANHVDDVVFHLVVDVNVVDDFARFEDVLDGDYLLRFRSGTGAAHRARRRARPLHL